MIHCYLHFIISRTSSAIKMFLLDYSHHFKSIYFLRNLFSLLYHYHHRYGHPQYSSTLLKKKYKSNYCINRVNFISSICLRINRLRFLLQSSPVLPPSKSVKASPFSLRSLLFKMNCLLTSSPRTLSSQTLSQLINPIHNRKNSYRYAIERLNLLQSSTNFIKERVAHYHERSTLSRTEYYLSSLGITVETLNKLNIIHVAGTKGKGSTCAFVESILRANGFKTGFFSSPHLMIVRERIRINGDPISEEKFSSYFENVFRAIEKAYENNCKYGMPGYFNFLTIMAFYVFLNENVDVAIIEVGIGGKLDCTNVVMKPIVTGITSLDYDHCALLGHTLPEIASQKAGIFKPGVPAMTVAQSDQGALEVLRKKAEEIQAPFCIVPDWSKYPGASKIILGIKGEWATVILILVRNEMRIKFLMFSR
ncbi:hypothetical protein SSS_04082 [Sarcoptes scabiei]|nr:hypothetical protein SSS_04082 [Sarcoptes scabiei]